MEGIGKTIIFVGIAIIVFGAIVLFISRMTGGRSLPGDIVIHRRNITIYFPIITSIIISIILTVLLWIIAAFTRK